MAPHGLVASQSREPGDGAIVSWSSLLIIKIFNSFIQPLRSSQPDLADGRVT